MGGQEKSLLSYLRSPILSGDMVVLDRQIKGLYIVKL